MMMRWFEKQDVRWESHVVHVTPQCIVNHRVECLRIIDATEEEIVATFSILFNNHLQIEDLVSCSSACPEAALLFCYLFVQFCLHAASNDF